MKTGALTLDSNEDDVSEVEACVAQPVIETVCNSAMDGQEECKDKSQDGAVTPDCVSVEDEAVDGVVSGDEGECDDVHGVLEDGDLLDLLVDTLDVEFDPNLMVA